jgi:hypothetical protein
MSQKKRKQSASSPYDTMYETILGKLQTHLSVSANKLVVACFVTHGGVCMSQDAASAESMQLPQPRASGLASSAPLLVSSDPGISAVGTAHCAVIPEGLKIGKVNFGAIGAIAGVSDILDHTTKAELLLPDGSQPNNILYILRECVQTPLHTDSHSNLHQLCAIMQENIRRNFTVELTANVGQFIADSLSTLASIQSEIDQITPNESDKPIDKKRNAAKLEKAMERLHDAVIDLHSQEQLARNLRASTLFSSHVEPRCLFNKMYVRNTERERFPSPDWHIQLFARDGRLLVANMAELRKGKPQKTRSKPWAIVEPMDGIDDPAVIATEYGMDLLTLVSTWKQRRGEPDSVTTQDILAFLKDCGAEEVILVDCTCNVFIDPDTMALVYCDPSQVNGKGCSACGTTYDKHSFGGGRGMRRAYIKTVRRRRNKSKSKSNSRSTRRRVRI